MAEASAYTDGYKRGLKDQGGSPLPHLYGVEHDKWWEGHRAGCAERLSKQLLPFVDSVPGLAEAIKRLK